MNETEKFYFFSGLVSRAYKSLRRAQEKYTREYGLRSVHVACMLRLLDAPGGLTASELSRACGVDRAQISRVVSELGAAGLLEEAAPGEKRRYRGCLTLTGLGREKAEALRGIVVEKFQAVDEELDGEDVAAFYRVFNAVAEKLEDI